MSIALGPIGRSIVCVCVCVCAHEELGERLLRSVGIVIHNAIAAIYDAACVYLCGVCKKTSLCSRIDESCQEAVSSLLRSHVDRVPSKEKRRLLLLHV
jgi:hypothetical protein